MKKLIKMPSIGQFRNVIRDLQHMSRFVGLDDQGKPIYDTNIEYPTVMFTGTVKAHGTNASFALNSDGEGWFQSKGNVLSIEKDNAGFCFFGTAREKEFRNIVDQILENERLSLADGMTIAVYGEFCGGNIQKGVAISGLDKMFILFGAKISNGESSYWVDIKHVKCFPDKNMYNISTFGEYRIAVNLQKPEESQNILIDLTHEVERLCPIGAYFGRTDVNSKDYNTIGEGIVWECNFKDTVLRFKVKGEKHSSSKVKKLASVDPEKLASVKEFVEYSVTENRCNQAIEQVFAGSTPIGVESTGDFIKWVKGDIVKEEMDTMASNGLEMRDVAGPISRAASSWFKNYLNSLDSL